MSKRRKKWAPSAEELGLDAGVDPKLFFHAREDRKINYKAQQVSKEVERTLSFILNSNKAGEILQSLNLLYVEPLPNSSHLIVVVSPGYSETSLSEREILEALQNASGWIRKEIGYSLHRRRVPELSFRVLTYQQKIANPLI